MRMRIEYGGVAEAFRQASRRDVLIKAGKVGLVAGAFALTGAVIKRSLLHTDKREPIAKPEKLDIYPGWIGVDQDIFFDSEKGPERFMRAAILGNPILMEITRRVLSDYAQAYETDRRLGLDEIYRNGLRYSRDIFATIGRLQTAPGLNSSVEALVAGTVAIAFASSGWAQQPMITKN